METLNAETTTNGFVSIKKVLVAVDLSRHSRATAMYAADIAKVFNASLTIVYVCEPVPLSDYASEAAYTFVASRREEIQTQLDELTQRLRKPAWRAIRFFRWKPSGRNYGFGARDWCWLDRNRQSSSEVAHPPVES